MLIHLNHMHGFCRDQKICRDQKMAQANHACDILASKTYNMFLVANRDTTANNYFYRGKKHQESLRWKTTTKTKNRNKQNKTTGCRQTADSIRPFIMHPTDLSYGWGLVLGLGLGLSMGLDMVWDCVLDSLVAHCSPPMKRSVTAVLLPFSTALFK